MTEICWKLGHGPRPTLANALFRILPLYVFYKNYFLTVCLFIERILHSASVSSDLKALYKSVIIRSTSESRPNSIEGKNVCPSVRPYVRPSTKSFFNLNESWYIGRGRWLLQDDMPYGRIEGQGQAHEPFKVWIPSIFKIYLLRHLQRELTNDHWFLN